MTPAQFLDTTPRQLTALQARYKVQVQQADYRAALITSILYNSNRGKDQPTRSAASFFTSLSEFEQKEKEKEQVVMGAEKQQKFLEMLFGPANK